ncbi:hypothetical protein U1Q18_012677 [Sarracenia purpurea var. burkii]
MEFPFGHHTHSHHHPRDERDEEYPPPPPPPTFGGSPPFDYGANEPPPPPPHVTHVYHSSDSHLGGGGGGGGGGAYPPAPHPDYHSHHNFHVGGGGGGAYPAAPVSDYRYQQPPPPSQNFDFSGSHGYPTQEAAPSSVAVHHVSHDSPLQNESESNWHPHRPHPPSFLHHHQNQHQEGSDLAAKPTVRIFSKAETNYSLTIRDEKVILARSNPSDPLQHWIKDEKYSTKVKDEEGFPSFALVNKATGQAIKHSVGATHPVQVIPYNADVLDESVLWTQSKDLGDGYRTIRMVNNIRLNVDAFNGDKNHGGVHDGTTILLWEWKKGDNQRWKIIPY